MPVDLSVNCTSKGTIPSLGSASKSALTAPLLFVGVGVGVKIAVDVAIGLGLGVVTGVAVVVTIGLGVGVVTMISNQFLLLPLSEEFCGLIAVVFILFESCTSTNEMVRVL